MTLSMVSLWLIPDPVSAKPLQSLHTALAEHFAAPRFDLHLTLLGGRALDAERLASILPEIARGIAPFSAPVLDIGTSESYFQSFYALFAAEGPVLELKRRAMYLAVNEEIGRFMPHVSLLYGPVEPAAKAKAAEAAREALTGLSLRFTSVALALSSDSVPVADWRILSEMRLG